MRNSVSAVDGKLAATSALPMPATHSALSRETMAMPAPGVLVSCNTFFIAACSSTVDFGQSELVSAMAVTERNGSNVVRKTIRKLGLLGFRYSTTAAV